MKTLTLAATALAALMWSSASWAHPTAVVDVHCEGRYAVATFTYTASANGFTATQTLTIDGVQVAERVTTFGTAGDVQNLSGPVKLDLKPHTITGSTVVTDDNPGTQDPRATATDTAVCTGPPPPCVNPDAPGCKPPPPPCKGDECKPPPPCEGDCAPPPEPFCVTHPNSDQCGELPHTGGERFPAYLYPLGILAAALIGTGVLLMRKRGQS